MSYLLFAAETYYARGGWADHRATLVSLDDTLTEARRLTALSTRNYVGDYSKPGHHPDNEVTIDWWHIVHEQKVIASGYNDGNSERQVWTENLDPNQTPWWDE